MLQDKNFLINDIRETFYNTIICVALENNIGAIELNGLNRMQILMNILSASLKRIRTTSHNGFYTLKNVKIVQNNVPECFKELYLALENTKLIDDNEILSSMMNNISITIMNNAVFTTIIHNVINFYREMNGLQPEQSISQNHEFKKYIKNPNSDNMIENIRETFYNTMISAANMNIDIIPPQDIINFEPYAIIGMPALSIIYNIYFSLDTNGIKLLNGEVVTLNNCPIYKELFVKMFEVKDLIKNKKLTSDQLLLLKYKCVNNPSINIPEAISHNYSNHINKIASIIIDIALDVSKLFGFKQNFTKIL